MHVGKPERRFVVRVIDLKTKRSKNFSIYDGNTVSLNSIYSMIKQFAEKVVGELDEERKNITRVCSEM